MASLASSLQLDASATDLAIAGLVTLLALVAFVAVNVLAKQAAKPAGGPKPAVVAGSITAVVDGKTVRRSARSMKERPEPASPKAEPTVSGACVYVRALLRSGVARGRQGGRRALAAPFWTRG
jgi:hypothetical protein